MPRLAFDIAVVGGGAAGCVVASRLAGSGDRSVVINEAGPDVRSATPAEWRDGWSLPTLPDWGFEAEADDSATPKKLRRGRVLGGTSWFTRFAVRGAASDFDDWAARGNPGWTFADVLPTFRRVEADAEFGGSPWHGDRGPIPITRYPELEPSEIHTAALQAFDALGFPTVLDHNEPTAVGVGRMPMSTRGGIRVTTVDAYLPADTQVPNLTVRESAPVAKVVVEAGRATGVELVDGSRIRAEWTVLAAGTYGSPAILMRSGIGPADHLRSVGIEVQVDLPGVGANLADHPGVDLDSGWRGTGTKGAILHSIATWRSAARPPGTAPDLMFWVTDPDADDPGFFLDPVLLKPASRARSGSVPPIQTPHPGSPCRAWASPRTSSDSSRATDLDSK
jgi:choline dehydrogenase